MFDKTKRHFISLKGYSRSELEYLLDLALQMKHGQDRTKYLLDKYIGMLFASASTRTRISFQVGAHQLGAHAEHYSSSDLQLSNHESLGDTGAVMGRFLDMIVIRMYDMNFYGKGREALEKIAQMADVPVINALDDKDHPCQIMADILTLKEKFGDNYKKKTLLMTWGYSKRLKSPGVLHSMLTAASILGMKVRFAHPKGYELDDEYLEFAKLQARTSGAEIEFCNDLMEASTGVDTIYVKNWKSLKMTSEEDQKLRSSIQDKWCVGTNHFERANPGAYYMDCMPFIRGEQVTAEVADGPNSIIYSQAENRLHAQKAIMACIAQQSFGDRMNAREQYAAASA
jgi:ornithine carbamoyltransferase